MKENDRIIVMGASAGGVNAVLRICRDLASPPAAPILLVLHVGAHRSLLPELIAQAGNLEAFAAESGMVPRAGCVYVAPPDRHLLFEAGALRLTRGPKEHHTRPAINPLFRSVALELGPRAVGVILTGTMDDGAAGLRAIVACGGTAVVQDPAEAEEPSMPLSALAATNVDHVVRLSAFAPLIASLSAPLVVKNPPTAPDWLRVEHAISLGITHMSGIEKIGTPSKLTCPDCGGALFELIEGRPPRFLCHTGHAFSLRSLAAAHEPLTDAALWSGMRALQEKEAILRRLADAGEERRPGSSAATIAEADDIRTFVASMRKLVAGAPSSIAHAEPAMSPAAEDEV